MCGGIKIQGRTFIVQQGELVLPSWTRREGGGQITCPVPISRWRFIRKDKIDSFWSLRVAEWVQLQAEEFYERGTWFPVHQSNSLMLGLYEDHDNDDGWTCGIVTVHATGDILKVHHRMPWQVPTWHSTERLSSSVVRAVLS